ncbi:MAG: mechanosensitive ion channel domain-containing protein [Halochromatium sp.]|uniref:mechanosensitive ion channel domain-containing protein n=1 Tax=Halochromatium sp. TaxID=2049430 RepID=UPI00397AB6D7
MTQRRDQTKLAQHARHLLVIGLYLLALFSVPAAAQAVIGDVSAALPSAELLNDRMTNTESAADLVEDSKTRLLSLYRRALDNLRKAQADRAAAEQFLEALNSASADAQAIRDQLISAPDLEAQGRLPIDRALPLRELEASVQQDQGDLALLDKLALDLSAQLDEAAARPIAIRERLRQAEEESVQTRASLQALAPSDKATSEGEAQRWALETKLDALSAEIERLNQELLSQPARIELLEARRDKAMQDAARIRQRLALLEDLITERRQAAAQQAQEDAEAKRLETEGKDPLVARLAEQNAMLSSSMAEAVAHLGAIRLQTETTQQLQQQIEGDYQSAREVIAIGGSNLSGQLGNLLRQQRESLPDLKAFEREARKREELASQAGVKRVLHRREQQRLTDTDVYVTKLFEEAGATARDGALRQRLVDLVDERRSLLNQAIESEDLLLRRLGELETAQTALLETIERFDTLLDVNLLWVRSASRTELAELGALPDQVWRIISPSGWSSVVGALIHQATHSPVFVLLGAFLITFLWGRRHLIGLIQATSERIGKPTTDRFLYSLEALAATLVAAAAWPLSAAVVGWQLQASSQATDFSFAVGGALLALAMQFYFLRALRLICIPHGLAAAHFRWPTASLTLLRVELDRLTWTFLPAAGVMLVIVRLDPLNAGWVFGRTAFVVLALTLAVAFYRLLHPRTGIFAHTSRRASGRPLPFLYGLLYPVLVIAPLALGVLELLGYLYTAETLLGRFVQSAWMIIALILLSSLARRWLQVTRRRFVYDKAMARRQAAAEAHKRDAEQSEGEQGSGLTEVNEPQIDLDSLTNTSRDLITSAVVAAALMGLWIIWSDVIPALQVFDQVTLWRHTLMVGGEEQIEPVTLADLGLALAFGVATFVLAKQLPALLEMTLLHHTRMAAGSRYTVITLTNYTIITLGLLLVFGTLGVQWSKLQWLVAALGVGIGFGLQEIVANFISGLIILFERPVRVGDIVTVGDTDGVVTKIQIRATTIRNWDRKELLVPNKEFVTGRLLNWSLSDQMTRVVVVVGVAYGSDVDKALDLMREAAREHERVLDDPAPILSFEGFGDNSLTLILRAYLSSVDDRIATITDLHKAINRKFAEAGIVIAFPQRDLHLDTNGPLRVQLQRDQTYRGDSHPPSGDC